MFAAKSLLILLSLWGYAHADICFDDDDDMLYCDYGCCGFNNDYCCDDTYWGAGSIAGTAVGLTFFCFFVALIVICCRRRRRLAPVYLGQQQSGTGVTVVQSSSTQQLNSVAANVAPVYNQYPGQPGYAPPGYPTGAAQPPPYAAR